MTRVRSRDDRAPVTQRPGSSHATTRLGFYGDRDPLAPELASKSQLYSFVLKKRCKSDTICLLHSPQLPFQVLADFFAMLNAGLSEPSHPAFVKGLANENVQSASFKMLQRALEMDLDLSQFHGHAKAPRAASPSSGRPSFCLFISLTRLSVVIVKSA